MGRKRVDIWRVRTKIVTGSGRERALAGRVGEKSREEGFATMWTKRWVLALGMGLVATLGSARGATIRDGAGMFRAETLRKAEADLNRVERELQLDTTIETVGSLEGEGVVEVTRRHAERSGAHGLFILIAKKESKIDVVSSSAYRRSMTGARLRAIQDGFVSEFKKGDLDAGLLGGVEAISKEATAAKRELGSLKQAGAGANFGRGVARGGRAGGGFGLGSLLGIGLLVVGVLFVVRLLGSMMGGGNGGQGGRMGSPGFGGGQGGGGGGFMSSMFGGIGGALAGNWLYDQFSGRNHGGGYSDQSAAGDGSGGDAGGDTFGGGGDAGGGDWGGGGGDAGGGDWGGGGGGDWGGGGNGGDW